MFLAANEFSADSLPIGYVSTRHTAKDSREATATAHSIGDSGIVCSARVIIVSRDSEEEQRGCSRLGHRCVDSTHRWPSKPTRCHVKVKGRAVYAISCDDHCLKDGARDGSRLLTSRVSTRHTAGQANLNIATSKSKVAQYTRSLVMVTG